MAERRQELDTARGIGILLVVYGHALEWLFNKNFLFNAMLSNLFSEHAFAQWNFIYSFHMPLFFMLSGMANSDILKISGKVASSSVRLLIIAYLTHFITSCIGISIGIITYHTVGEAVRDLVFPVLKGDRLKNVVMWFLVCLAVSQTIFYLTFATKSKIWYRAAIITITIGLYFSSFKNDYNYMQVKTWSVALAFFVVGWLLARSRIVVPAWFGPPALVIVAVLAPLNHGCALSFHELCQLDWLPNHFSVSLAAGRTGNVFLFYVTALIGALGILGCDRLLRSSFTSWCGRHSLDILIVNGVTFLAIYPSNTSLSNGELSFGYIMFVAVVSTMAQVFLASVLDTT